MSAVEKSSNKNKGGNNVTWAEDEKDRLRQKPQHTGGSGRRGSDLIHKRASITLDWCARQGLLSSQSLRRLSSERKREEKRQMKEKTKTMEKLLQKKKTALKQSSQPSQLPAHPGLNDDELMGSSELEASFVKKEEHKTTLNEDVSDTASTEECDDDDDDDDVSLDMQHVVGRKNNTPTQHDNDRSLQSDGAELQQHIQVPDEFVDDVSSIGLGVNNNMSIAAAEKIKKGVNIGNNVHQGILASSSGALDKSPADISSVVNDDVEKTSTLHTDFLQQQELLSSSTMTKTMKQGHNRRQSSLIPVAALQDASWFAERGLMSRKSYKQYQKEKIDRKSRPKPLIEVDDLSLSSGSDISGLDLHTDGGVGETESASINSVNGSNAEPNTFTSSMCSHPSGIRNVTFRERVSAISAEENLGDNQVTIKVPDNFTDVNNISSIGFNYFTSSKTLQQHWAQYGGGGEGDEEEDEDSITDDDYEVYINPSRSDENGTSVRRIRKRSILRKQKSAMSTGTAASKRVSFNSMLMNETIEVKKRTSIAKSEISELTYGSKPLLAEDDKNVNPSSPEASSTLTMGLDSLLNPQAGGINNDCDKGERDVALAQVIKSVLESNTERGNIFSPDEVSVLHKMVRKLSSQEFTNNEDDRKHNDDSSTSQCDSAPGRGLKGSFSSNATLKTDNTSCSTSSQASMLAKVAKDMSVSLERSKSLRSKHQYSSKDSTAKNDTFEHVHNEQSKSTKLPAAQDALQVEENDRSKSTKLDKSDGCAKIDESVGTKSAIEALIEKQDSSLTTPASSILSSKHRPSISSSVICLAPPSETETDSKDLSNCEQGQRERSETSARKTSARKSKSSTPNAESGEDILTMGINYISVTMLANIYGMLREMSMLGHASVRLQDFDVNSHQRNSRMKELKRLNLLKPEEEKKGYLETTLTAGYIIRTALDEYEMFESSSNLEIGALSQLKKASMEYDATMARDFKALVAESLSDHFDGKCFQKGSVMRELVDSGLEIVWISDRHPNDVNYCICVNRDESRVIVVFRGDESVIRRIQNSQMIEYENPLSGVLQGTEIIKLRAAASKDILTPRLDTKQSIVEEIQQKVKRIQKELNNGGELHVTVSGHNKGGGLASVTAFYLASSNDLKLSSPIEVVTFASPRVGDKNFQRSFQHLEDSGRIVYARFTNSNDMISLRPFLALSGSWKFEDWYKHVGLQICLGTRSIQGYDIKYRRVNMITDELWNMITSYFCGHSKHSSIFEYYRRMRVARKLFSSQQKRIGKRNRRNLITLKECYALQQSFIELDRDMKSSYEIKLVLVTFFVLIEIGLFFRMLLKYYDIGYN